MTSKAKSPVHKMFVYVKTGYKLKRVGVASLLNCCTPSVGGFVETTIEPQLWFKVLCLDSILVDCDDKNVYWNVETCAEAQYIHGHKENKLTPENVVQFYKEKESMFEEGSFQDYDPYMSQLFHWATDCTKMSTKDNMSGDEKVMRLLHVYILPQIEFSRNHKDPICSALGSTQYQCMSIEASLAKKDILFQSLKLGSGSPTKQSKIKAIKKEIRELVSTKLKIAAVQMAAQLTLKEINEFGMSQGFHRQKGMSAVIQPECKPYKWKTLQENVHDIVNLDSGILRAFSHVFCEITTEKCHNAIKQYHNDPEAMVYLKISSDGIVSDIVNHFKDMANKITAHMPGVKQKNIHTTLMHVYTVYESIVSEKLIPVLRGLYLVETQSRCRDLAMWMSTVSAEDIGVDCVHDDSILQACYKCFLDDINRLHRAPTLFTQHKALTRTLRCLQLETTKTYTPECVSTDHFLDLVVKMLFQLPTEKLIHLYATVSMMSTLKPPFTEGSVSEYALTIFSSAFRFLFAKFEETSSETVLEI